jgi:hypothetical protein
MSAAATSMVVVVPPEVVSKDLLTKSPCFAAELVERKETA